MIDDSELKISSARITANAIALGLGEQVTQAHRDQVDIEAALKKDKTKTKASKDLFAAKTASKRLQAIWKQTTKKQDQIKHQLEAYQRRIDSKLSINGTTDLVILNSYSSILKDMTTSQVSSLIRAGDIDAGRAALLVPALRLTEKFRNAQDMIKGEVVSAVLGDDNKAFEDLQEQLATADKLETVLLETSSEYDKRAKGIEATIVSAEVANLDTDEQPEVG
jgi:hypothetical protein